MHSPDPSAPETPSAGAVPDPTLAELVTAVAGRLRATWRDGLAPYGLSPHQGRALLVVALTPGLRPSDLATRLRIAPRSVTEVVDGLVDGGLLTRTPDPGDRRAVLLDLSEEGRARVASIREARERTAEELFGRLQPRERDQLRRLLGRLAHED